MSPIFTCKGCGTFIERSSQHYRRVKGQVLCSTCSDAQRRELALQQRSALARLWSRLKTLVR
ncbi:MAG: hypothetical protein ACO28R_05115 [Vulcanococcus sp.]